MYNVDYMYFFHKKFSELSNYKGDAECNASTFLTLLCVFPAVSFTLLLCPCTNGARVLHLI